MGAVGRRLRGVEPAPERRTYTVKEVAALLGLGETSVYAALQAGEIKAIRVGSRWAVPRAWLDRLLAGDEGE